MGGKKTEKIKPEKNTKTVRPAALIEVIYRGREDKAEVESQTNLLQKEREIYLKTKSKPKKKIGWKELLGFSEEKKMLEKEEGEARVFYNYLKRLRTFQKTVVKISKKDTNQTKEARINTIWRISLVEELERLTHQLNTLRYKGFLGWMMKEMNEWSKIPLLTKIIISIFLFLAAIVIERTTFIKDGSLIDSLPWHALFTAWGTIVLLEGIQQSLLRYWLSKRGLTYQKIILEAKRKIPNNFKDLEEKLEKSFLEYWEKIQKAESIRQKYLMRRYLSAGIAGSLIGALPYLPNGVFYYLKISVIDMATRYLWFLIPYTLIHKRVSNFVKKSSPNSIFPPKESWFIEESKKEKDPYQRRVISRDKQLSEMLDKLK